MNFGVNFIFLILRTKRAFKMKLKAFPSFLKSFQWSKQRKTFLEPDSPTLSSIGLLSIRVALTMHGSSFKNRHFVRSSAKYSLKFNNIIRNRWWLKWLCAEPPPVSEPHISQGHVIKGSCNIIGRSPSKEAIILSSLVATLVIEIWWFLFVTWPCKTTWSKLCMTLWLGACQGISPP